ncbi:MAG TPA: cytochrome d ubiquinol oxidase subunit II [Candidatus Krumholzibacteria bacterium]|nr:cytochrome d ubiquinol oxidase subunit II [Candidatus Krumholzibacteria bacterium]HPD72203.1 cytochrome d ubiquinol oxidase subunit II [Candidatus Krumholzibacteria bacterium]HRY40865.1 cytochrome d ubiquinol oxidase subunit II [Candidatus Krumholzibacteria bacterium]
MGSELYNVIWYALVGILLTGYAILDGFDLGTGALHLLARSDRDRRVFLNAIGPFWDGNQVWLVTGGGALFAAFPHVYATAFSGFYVAFILLLFMLIFRGVSIHVRSLRAGRAWRAFWDWAFSASSVIASLLIGVALGNVAWGVPIEAGFRYRGDLLQQIHPYSLLTGIMVVAVFMMHGAIYLVMKTEGDLNQRVRGWVRPCIIFFVLMYAVTTLATLLYLEHMAEPFRRQPLLFLVPALNVLAIANIPREMHLGREVRAFTSSAVAMALLLLLFGLGMFPELIHSRPDVANSLTAYNASSSPLTLKTMLVMAAIGMPLVIGYTIHIYRVFKGKVKLDSMSY